MTVRPQTVSSGRERYYLGFCRKVLRRRMELLDPERREVVSAELFYLNETAYIRLLYPVVIVGHKYPVLFPVLIGVADRQLSYQLFRPDYRGNAPGDYRAG